MYFFFFLKTYFYFINFAHVLEGRCVHVSVVTVKARRGRQIPQLEAVCKHWVLGTLLSSFTLLTTEPSLRALLHLGFSSHGHVSNVSSVLYGRMADPDQAGWPRLR